MERILHRGNTLDRIRAAQKANFDRLEIDLHWYGGKMRICHDWSLGPLVLGFEGVASPKRHLLLPRFAFRLLTLEELLAGNPLPLLIDLKRRWNRSSLASLANLLRKYHRAHDALCSSLWENLDSYAEFGEDQRFYTVDEKNFDIFLDRLAREGFPGVSISALSLIE